MPGETHRHCNRAHFERRSSHIQSRIQLAPLDVHVHDRYSSVDDDRSPRSNDGFCVLYVDKRVPKMSILVDVVDTHLVYDTTGVLAIIRPSWGFSTDR